jgi:hypothetical protein
MLTYSDDEVHRANQARIEIVSAIPACLSSTYYTGYRYIPKAPGSAEDEKVANYKLHQAIRHTRHSPHFLRAIAHAPVFVAVVSALAVTSLPPTYFSIRHAFFFAVGIIYHIISPSLTSVLRRWRGLRAVRWKNAVIAAIMIVIFFLNGCGYFFNNCRGWTTILPRGQNVVLFSNKDFDRNDFVIFPIIVSLCISTQISLCVIVTQMYSRDFDVMKLIRPS